MTVTACPHCGLSAMSPLRKLALGWARQVPCRACGLRVTVSPLPAVAAMLPSLAVVLAVSLHWVRDPVLMVLLGAVALATTGALHLWAVPLVKGQVTDARAVARARGQGQGGSADK